MFAFDEKKEEEEKKNLASIYDKQLLYGNKFYTINLAKDLTNILNKVFVLNFR